MTESGFDRAEVLRENEVILARFRDNGADLSGKKTVDFDVILPSRDACVEVRQIFQSKYKLPKDAVFVNAHDVEDGWRLNLDLEMTVTAEKITEIECLLLEASKGFVAAEVYWEFQE